MTHLVVRPHSLKPLINDKQRSNNNAQAKPKQRHQAKRTWGETDEGTKDSTTSSFCSHPQLSPIPASVNASSHRQNSSFHGNSHSMCLSLIKLPLCGIPRPRERLHSASRHNSFVIQARPIHPASTRTSEQT